MFSVHMIGFVGVLGSVLLLPSVVGLDQVEEAAREQALRRVAATRSSVAHALQARQARQALVANLLVESELLAAMATLAEFRQDLEAAYSRAYEQAAGTSVSAVEARERFIREVRKDDVSLPDLFASHFAAQLERHLGHNVFGPKGRDAFLAEEADRFAKCAAFGGVDQCQWDYTYNTLPKVFAWIAMTKQITVEQRVFVVGPDGVGLADSGNPQWSKAKGFGQRTRLPMEAMRTGLPVRGLALVEENRYFVATAVPILHEGRTLGAVLVADPMDERMAREDSDVVGADVLYVMGDKVVAAPLAADIANKLAADPQSVPTRATASFRLLDDEEFQDLRVVVSQDLGTFLAVFKSAETSVLLLHLLLTVIAVGVLLWLLHTFYQQFEALDQGVHEVINGNLDYQFPFDFKEDLARRLGQSLNLMSAVLQGRPLPEEVEEEEAGKTSWAAEIQVLDSGETEPEWGESSRPTVACDFNAARSLAEEPADAYYKRIYAEFLDARRALGLPTEGINYPKFLERMVNLEQGLKKRYRCPMVRFRVKTRDGAVVFEPIPVRKLPH